MEGLLSLLLFAAFFYFMMRFGCGAHMVHGGHGGHGSGSEGHESRRSKDRAGSSSKDPVCGMTVAPDDGYSRMYQGRAYQFCSRRCLDQFDSDPAHYTA